MNNVADIRALSRRTLTLGLIGAVMAGLVLWFFFAFATGQLVAGVPKLSLPGSFGRSLDYLEKGER